MATHSDAARGEGPQTQPTGIAADINDELRDHLECRRDELEAAGVSATNAPAEALRRFGDLERIVRELNWLHNGSRIMKHRLIWGTGAAIIVALCIALFIQSGKYRVLLDERSVLEADLARRDERLSALKDGIPTASARIQIVDESGNPRAGRTVEIGSSDDTSREKYAATVTSDAHGTIDTGPLMLGGYWVADRYPELGAGEHISSLGFKLVRLGDVVDVKLVVPNIESRAIQINRPEIPPGWKVVNTEWTVTGPGHFRARGSFVFNGYKRILVNDMSSVLMRFSIRNPHLPAEHVDSTRGLSWNWEPGHLPAHRDVVTLGRVEFAEKRARFVSTPTATQPAASQGK
ncbi:MAG: hypothetical protein IT450_21560 [Phycisphaerales bacterium]|nr:hypothetical protein [Phycisphaerales bacterium]